jgi:hypothetical protein
MVVEVARCFNDNFSSFNMTAISPGYTNILLRGALHHIRSSDQVGSVQWLADIESFRKALRLFKHRWKISGKWLDREDDCCCYANFRLRSENYLREIDSAAQAVTSAPLCEYSGFVRPQGNRLGLC